MEENFIKQVLSTDFYSPIFWESVNIYKVFNNVQYRLLDNKENFSHVVNMALGKEANCSFAEAADALGVSK